VNNVWLMFVDHRVGGFTNETIRGPFTAVTLAGPRMIDTLTGEEIAHYDDGMDVWRIDYEVGLFDRVHLQVGEMHENPWGEF
jgi:hypothetical protein